MTRIHRYKNIKMEVGGGGGVGALPAWPKRAIISDNYKNVIMPNSVDG